MKAEGGERLRGRERALLAVVGALNGLSHETAWRVLRAAAILCGFDERELIAEDEPLADGDEEP
jgi:hypothetical protein